MSAGKQYFGNYDIPKSNPNQISFGGKVHEYEIPEIFPFIDKIRKVRPDIEDDSLKIIYERKALAKALDMKPSFLRSGISDDLLFGNEDNLDDALVKDYKDTFGKTVKKIDDIPDEDKNYLIAQRMDILQSPSFLPLKDFALEKFNPAARAEAAKWEYKPEFTGANQIIQNTSPSRQSSLGMTGQQIDPNYPLFLQVGNPNIPWDANHPLRKKFREEGSAGVSQEDFNSRLATLDSINSGGSYVVPSQNPFWRQPEKYPALTRELEARDVRQSVVRQDYPQFYREQDRLPVSKSKNLIDAQGNKVIPSDFQKRVLGLFEED
jgi:hypothetical protein